MIRLDEINQAQARIAPYLTPTPLEAAAGLGKDVWLKLENINKTHSFKIRGALNALLSLGEKARERGVIAASSGNHAGALAYAAQLSGVSAQIFMPKTTPQKKIANVRHCGAEAILFGDNYDEAESEALRRAGNPRVWISPYNDRAVIAGTGTIGLEILDQLPEVARVIIPVSGGGLMAGVATALKLRKPEIDIIGVNARSAPALYNIFYSRHLPQVWDTLADALSGEIEVGSITLPICLRHMDDIALVDEAGIAAAMRAMLAAGWVVEGGGAVGVAALLGNVSRAANGATVVVLSGGNVDLSVLRRVLSPHLKWRGG
ncbi:MAG: threonine/serine dehydratase [Chloroflexi bacterium]|nr:threonine/serine dehydratase [Chloroflexota bacterium]